MFGSEWAKSDCIVGIETNETNKVHCEVNADTLRNINLVVRSISNRALEEELYEMIYLPSSIYINIDDE